MLKTIPILPIMLFFSSLVFTQPPPVAAPKSQIETPKVSPWDSIKDLPAKQPFISLEGRFSISFNKQIQGFAALSPKQLGIQATGMQFTWKFQEGESVIIFVDFPESDLKGTEGELQKISTNLNAAILQNFPQGKAITEKFFRLGEVPASQTNFELAENKFGIQRLYLVKNRLYRVLAIYQNTENEKFLNNTFDTFKLISKAEVDAELQRKFEAMKPPALPQEPIVSKEKTDAQDENLKGKVKKIVVESEDLSGTWSVQGRKPSSVTYFNEKGNYVERDLYDSQGNPFQITIYGYIDGKRVSNSKTTSYEYDPPPMAIPKSKADELVKKSDPRYEYSFGYKYKEGKLAEKQMFFSNGKKGMRYVYNHNDNQVEELVFTSEGELNQKYLVTIDKDGNEIEEISFGLKNYDIYGDRKYRYTYEFDDKGNWIKKITSTETNENGIKIFKPSAITYRTITYF
jgi:hypothetical protein